MSKSKCTDTCQSLPQKTNEQKPCRPLDPLHVSVPSRPSSPFAASQCELRLCLLQGSPGSLVAPPWTSTPRSLQEATLPWLTLPQRAKLATWLGGRTLSQRPTWDSSPTKAWDESKPPPKESWRSAGGRFRGERRDREEECQMFLLCRTVDSFIEVIQLPITPLKVTS